MSKFLFLFIAILQMKVWALDISYLQAANHGRPSVTADKIDLIDLIDFNRRGILNLLSKNTVFKSTRDDEKLTDLIDQALLDILRTPTGKQLCKQSLATRHIDLYAKIGLSPKAARLADSICPPTKNYQVDLSFDELSRYFDKKIYLFGFTSEQEKPFDSWTTAGNMARPTVILIDPKTVTAEYLYQTLAHEVYMTVDIKSSFPFADNQLGLPTLKTDCSVVAAVTDPLVRYSFNIFRAKQVENQILQELGFEVGNLPGVASVEDMYSIVRSLEPISASSFINNERRENICLVTYQSQDLSEKFQIVFNEKLDLKNNESVSLWQYLSTPQFSNVSVIQGREPGPRPSIGNGTSVSRIANKIQTEKVKELTRMSNFINTKAATPVNTTAEPIILPKVIKADPKSQSMPINKSKSFTE